MFSYVYMKILESQPERYDMGIGLLSMGQSEKYKRKLVDENVRSDSKVLEIGCGTGTMAILAAKKGAHVLGFDISGGMLAVAREKIEDLGLSEKIETVEMGISGMDTLNDESFDLVMSTLVFSELSHDEQAYAIRHALRILKPSGKLAIADEARPKNLLKRIVHDAVQIPMAILTFILTQTTTSAVCDLEEALLEGGFRIDKQERSSLDSFLYVVASKGGGK